MMVRLCSLHHRRDRKTIHEHQAEKLPQYATSPSPAVLLKVPRLHTSASPSLDM
jgi:hypothetical protein